MPLQFQQCYVDEETGDVVVVFHKTVIIRVRLFICCMHFIFTVRSSA